MQDSDMHFIRYMLETFGIIFIILITVIGFIGYNLFTNVEDAQGLSDIPSCPLAIEDQQAAYDCLYAHITECVPVRGGVGFIIAGKKEDSCLVFVSEVNLDAQGVLSYPELLTRVNLHRCVFPMSYVETFKTKEQEDVIGELYTLQWKIAENDMCEEVQMTQLLYKKLLR